MGRMWLDEDTDGGISDDQRRAQMLQEEFMAGESSNDAYNEYGYVRALIDLGDEEQTTVYFFRTR